MKFFGEQINMADGEGPLCCCEYYNIRKQRTHLLTFCCECDELDKTVDDWIKGNPQKLNRLTAIVESFCDRCRVPWFGGAKTFDFGGAFPAVLLPASAYIACWHYILTILIFLALPVMVISCYVLTIKLKMRTRLFLSLSITSTIGCYAVYFYYVAPFQTLQINAIHVASVIVILTCFKLSRRKPATSHLNSFRTIDSTFCNECTQSIPFRGKHCRYANITFLHLFFKPPLIFSKGNSKENTPGAGGSCPTRPLQIAELVRTAPEIFQGNVLAPLGVLHIHNLKTLTCHQTFIVFNSYLPWTPLHFNAW